MDSKESAESERSELSESDSLRSDENDSETKGTVHNVTRKRGLAAARDSASDEAKDDSSDVSEESSANEGTNSAATFKKPTVSKRFRAESRSLKIPDLSRPLLNKERFAVTDSQTIPLPYREPSWGGKPTMNFKIEVLKSGVIVEVVSLIDHSYYVVGRLPTCHVPLAHPTISRYHAVLQYKAKEPGKDEDDQEGFYLYDLDSTHGTYWNGKRIKPRVYVRLRAGHLFGFGYSQRKYFLQGPPEDEEEESPYSVSELQAMRDAELQRRREQERANERRAVEEEEPDGIDWGMSEDADEESDLQENPFASIAEDDLVLEDPKKTLRGWYEREGYDLHYQTEEKGLGQFYCWLDLPLEDTIGYSLRAEALVKGKKKEAVVQCAMEACRILDRHGLLRQANHEARRRKGRDWEAEDYYDSDEDNFLDRTGSIEKKRKQRMRLAGRLEEKADTYESLLEKHDEIVKQITELSSTIDNWQKKLMVNTSEESSEEDALDAYMLNLSSSVLCKGDVAKMKLKLQNLRKEKESLVTLLKLTQPANLPPLPDEAQKPNEPEVSLPKKNGSLRSKVQNRKIEPDTESSENTNKSCKTSVVASNAVGDKTTKAKKLKKKDEEIEEDDSDDDDRPTSAKSPHASLIKEQSDASVSAVPGCSGNRERVEETEKRRHEKKMKKPRRKEQELCCDQDAYADNYSTWVPPEDQKGDGKTSLNEKYGY